MAHAIARALGTPWGFLAAVLIVVGWALSGPIFGFSEKWQLFINTGTTVITFLMVFLIQNTQNRDTTTVHLKLDELIRAVKTARNTIVDLEDASEEEIEEFRQEFAKFRQKKK